MRRLGLVACIAGILVASAQAGVVVSFDAAAAGAGTGPDALGWTRSGVPMTNNGTALIQDNTGDDPVTQSGEYRSPATPGLMKRASGQYGVEVRVRPLSDMPLLSSSHYANAYVFWSDDQHAFNISIDLDADDAGPGTTGAIRYGQNSLAPAITGIDFSSAHTIFIGYRSAAQVFDLYLDGSPAGSLTRSVMARSGGFPYAQNAVSFGDGTVGQGLDVAVAWYFIRVYDQAAPPPPGELFHDSDKDGDVDISDFGRFQQCLTVPGGELRTGCGRFDLAAPGFPYGDQDVDATDLAAFLNCLSGAGVAPADPACYGTVVDVTRNHLGLYCGLLPTAEEYDALIGQAITHGVRTLIPSLSAGASVGFVTPKEPYLPDLADELAQGFDSLKVMIQKAHAVGMKVSPSIAVAPVNQLLFGHPEWETLDRSGQRSSVTTGASLAFSYPAARQAKIAMLMDLVNGYAIDGIWLDYCRYPENSSQPAYTCGFYGYDPPLIQQSLSQWGFDPRSEPVGSPNWELFNQLRRDSVTVFVQELRTAIHGVKPQVRIAGFGDSTLNNDLCAARDWPAWAQGGYIDDFYSGNYVVPIASMRAEMMQVRQFIGPNVRLHGALTPFNNFLSTEQQMVDATVELVEGGADGLWVYREDALTNNNLWNGAKRANDVFLDLILSPQDD